MSHRTYGETGDCKGCRYWSEMIAKAEGGGPVVALCLSPVSSMKGRYTHGYACCDRWESGHLGAVDEPGADGTEYESEA